MLVRKISAVALGLIVSMPAASNGGTIRDDVGGGYTTYDNAVLNVAGSDQYPAVGRLTSTAFLCSGTLIAPNWVVTAAHCVDSGSAKNMTFRVNGTSYTGATMLANPSWTGNLGAGNDIGLLKLQSNVSGVTPATRTSSKPLEGTTGVAVGFGRTGNGATGATGSAGTKHAGPLVIDQYGDASGFNWNERILLTDFDNPTKATDSTMGSTSPLDLEYDTASGDSGGALIVTDLSGNKLLAGVVSLGWAYDGNVNSDYGDGSGFTSIADFNTWIDSVINGSSGGSTGGGGKGKPRSVNIMSQEAGSVIAMTQMAVVPEPNSIVLLGLGMAGILSQRRRK